MTTPTRHLDSRAGLTLVELAVSLAVFSVVMGALFLMSFGFADTNEIHQAKNINLDDVRNTLQTVVPQLRQAAIQSLNSAELPGSTVRFRIPEDLDGNGTSVDVSSRVEFGAERTITIDTGDLNGDGITNTQLLMIVPGPDGPTYTVLANHLNDVQETVDALGVLGPEQDTNGNGQLDRGFWVQIQNGGLMVEIQAKQVSRKGHEFVTRLSEFVVPRN